MSVAKEQSLQSLKADAGGRAPASALSVVDRDAGPIKKPYLLFIGDCANEAFAKTAYGIRDWAGADVVGQQCFPGCRVDLGLAELTAEAAVAAGARSFVVAVAPAGGQLPEHWVSAIVDALHAGMDIVSGLHVRLGSIPAIANAAAQTGGALHDVRYTDRSFPIGTGKKRSGLRLLTVGTDCALGKKYTALSLAEEFKAQGKDATFRATGQTGIMIAGSGVAIDAVVSDFIAGAAETLSPDADPAHWDIIEGQGALFHPAYAGVTLGLIHGSQPDALVLCHDPTRRALNMYTDFPVPSLTEAARRYVEAARLTNAHARITGVSLNTSKLSDDEALTAARRAEDELGVPCMDPLRFGRDRVVARSLNEFA